jgi:hypothetical protein
MEDLIAPDGMPQTHRELGEEQTDVNDPGPPMTLGRAA